MNSELRVTQYAAGWAIAWWIVDEQRFGLYLGGRVRNISAYQDLQVAYDVLRRRLADGGEDMWRNDDCYMFQTQAAASRALEAVTAALDAAEAAKVAEADRSLPAWAVTALAAGWTAPKGWKP